MRPVVALVRGVLVCSLVFGFGCSIDDIDLTGKRCSASAPCRNGLPCVDGICQPSAPTCEPKFRTENFRVGWQTPSAVHWAWSPVGGAGDFVQYKLLLAQSELDLAEARQSALSGEDPGPARGVWTQAANPELGQYELRLSAGTDPVTSTTTDGLEPATEYRAQLLAYDAAGCVAESPVAVARTHAAALASFDLFDDEPRPSGTPRPEGIAVVETDQARAHAGDSFILWPGFPDDGSVTGVGYENVGVYYLRTELAVHYPSLDYSSAFLELALAIDGPGVAAWGEVRLLFGPSPGVCGEIIHVASITPYVLRPGGYHQLQLPLRAFRLGGDALPESVLREHSLCEVSVGRGWAVGEAVRLDSIRLRW